jgi:hypothetical protein
LEDAWERSVEIFFKTSSSLAFVRDARNSFAGEWAAMARAKASPRLFGPTPVMTTKDTSALANGHFKLYVILSGLPFLSRILSENAFATSVAVVFSLYSEWLVILLF